MEYESLFKAARKAGTALADVERDDLVRILSPDGAQLAAGALRRVAGCGRGCLLYTS